MNLHYNEAGRRVGNIVYLLLPGILKFTNLVSLKILHHFQTNIMTPPPDVISINPPPLKEPNLLHKDQHFITSHHCGITTRNSATEEIF